MTGITLERVRQRLAGRSPRRERASGATRAAVSLVLAPAPGRSGRLELLLIKRAEHRGDPWSGHMALPGGRQDREDADLLATVARETLEEVGIALEPAELLGELDDLRPRTPTLPPVVVRPFVFGLAAQPPIHPSAEVAGWVWVALDELASGRTRTEIEIPGRAGRLPGYRVGGEVVWGMTERIITPFLKLIR